MKRSDRFWDFSVSTYRQPGVADACLSLQERFGVDVNLLLYCCWSGCTRQSLDEPMFAAALSFSQPWADEVVRPLRAVRSWMKIAGCNSTDLSTDDCMALREKIKAVELEAEHLQQNALEKLTSTPMTGSLDFGTQVENTASNLRRYLEHCEVRLDEVSFSELAHIVTAAIDGADKGTVVNTLKTTFQET